MRLFVIVVLFLSSAIAWSNQKTCEAFFGPDIEVILERAGNLEAALTNTISQAKRASDVQFETHKLEKLQVMIEDMLNHDGTAEMAVRLEKEYLQLANEERQTVIQEKRKSVSIIPISEAKSALKDLQDLQPYLRDKYREFIEEASRVNALIEISPSWALERINVHDLTFEPTYSVRLNRGYRVVFVYERETGIRILRISMKVTHNK